MIPVLERSHSMREYLQENPYDSEVKEKICLNSSGSIPYGFLLVVATREEPFGSIVLASRKQKLHYRFFSLSP